MVMQEIRDWVAGWVKSRFYEKSEYKQTSSGVSSSGLPIRLDRNGKVDVSFLQSSDTAEYIADTVGAMVAGNTETDIAVSYQDADNTLDFVVNQSLIEEHTHAATSKTTPAAADELPLVDSAASNVLKKLTWSNLYTAIINIINARSSNFLTTGVGNEYVSEVVFTVGDVTRFQQVTIDLMIPQDRRSYVTDFHISFQRNGNATVWALAYGHVAWQGTAAGTVNITDSDTSFTCSGTPAGSVTAITGGIRILIDSSDFINTMNLNMGWIRTTGFDSNGITPTVTIT